MSELNDLVEEVVSDAEVMTVPIDDTLTISGEAADAKAVGDALALKADLSQVTGIDVNGQSADNQGHILIDGTDIPMSGTDSTTLKAKIEAVDGKTGADIPVSSTAGAATIQAAIEDAGTRNADEIMMATGSTTTVAAKIAAMDVTAAANSAAIGELEVKAGDDILLETGGSETIADAVNDRVKSVNGTGPDATGNVQVEHALTADDLTSSSSQTTTGEWTRRTSGGTTPIQTGSRAFFFRKTPITGTSTT